MLPLSDEMIVTVTGTEALEQAVCEGDKVEKRLSHGV